MKISFIIVSGIFVAFDIKGSEAFFFGNSQSNAGSFGGGFSPSSNSFLGTLTSGFGQGQQKDSSFGGYNYDPPNKLSNTLSTGYGQGLQTLTSGFNQGQQGSLLNTFSSGQQSQNSISRAFS